MKTGFRRATLAAPLCLAAALALAPAPVSAQSTPTEIDWCNGGLFATVAVPPLEKTDVAALQSAAAMDWRNIDPSIFGTLFERGLGVMNFAKAMLDDATALARSYNEPLPPDIQRAYDQYALDAFRVHAVDYLLKPIRLARLKEALARAHPRRPQRLLHPDSRLEDPDPLFLGLPDRDDDHLPLGQAGRADQPLVVSVGHDESPDQPGRNPPRSTPDVVEPAVRSLEPDVERPGEVLAQVMAGARLEALVVLHQGFQRVGADGAGELFAVGLGTGQHRHGHPLLHEPAVEAKDEAGFGFRFGVGCVRGMTLLPQELGGPEKEPGPQLPPDHVGPLVHQKREVAPALDPFGEHGVDDGLGGGPDHQRLLQLLPAAVGDHRGLRRETLDVFGFLVQEALGDEQGEIGVLMAGFLEHPVERPLDLLPDGVAVGADHHAASYRAVIGQLRLDYQLVVPGGKIAGPGCQSF